MNKNLDEATVNSFGDEWSRFDQSDLAEEEAGRIFDEYFAVFPWERLPKGATGFDMGCGSGRWAKLMAPRVGHLHCIDPSSALEVAKAALSSATNVSFHRASVDDRPLPPNSQDFGYSLGVLHHVPDTAAAIRACVEMLKPGAPFQVYLYYAFDNRSAAIQVRLALFGLVAARHLQASRKVEAFIDRCSGDWAVLPAGALRQAGGANGIRCQCHTFVVLQKS